MVIKKLNNLQPGEEMVYHTGNLAEESLPHLGKRSQQTEYSKALGKIRESAWELYKRGKLILIQRKVPNEENPFRGKFEYIAIRKVTD